MTQPNEQTKIIERDIARLADDHTKLNERFDRHLEIYSMNGKELAKLTAAVTSLRESFEKRNDQVDAEQINQWIDIKKNREDGHQMALTINTLVTRTAAWAALGSSIASTVAVFIVMKVLGG